MISYIFSKYILKKNSKVNLCYKTSVLATK